MNNTRKKIYRGVSDNTTFFKLAKIRASKRIRTMFYRGLSTAR
jgi:hypothetical protein